MSAQALNKGEVSPNTTLSVIEKTLNLTGYTTLTGPARMIFGVAEAIGAFAVSIFFPEKHASKYILHGLANMGRGFVESIPLINLYFIIYDYYLRYRYEGEAPTPCLELSHYVDLVKNNIQQKQPAAPQPVVKQPVVQPVVQTPVVQPVVEQPAAE